MRYPRSRSAAGAAKGHAATGGGDAGAKASTEAKSVCRKAGVRCTAAAAATGALVPQDGADSEQDGDDSEKCHRRRAAVFGRNAIASGKSPAFGKAGGEGAASGKDDAKAAGCHGGCESAGAKAGAHVAASPGNDQGEERHCRDVAVFGAVALVSQSVGGQAAAVAEAGGESTNDTVDGEGSYNDEGAVKSAGGAIRDGEIIGGGFRAVATSAGRGGVFTTAAEAAANGGASRKTAGGTTLGTAAETTASPIDNGTRQGASIAAGAGSRGVRCVAPADSPRGQPGRNIRAAQGR